MSKKLAGNRSPDWALFQSFRVPHYDEPGKTYLWRLRIIQTPWFGVYLHKLGTPDPRHVLHNHPWPFIAFILRGGYTEYVPARLEHSKHCYARRRKVRFVNIKRFNNSFHWINTLDRTPTWTLMFVGRRRRVWGYLDRDNTYTPFNEHPFNDAFENALAEKGDAA